ncbi:restriction endonuclease subunit S [uncultured Psychrobacter sp.]|uniref:restriction endonuclease subunit S n=1 Tax=uncultured Psychrobacter sp. TaxID=259303 RepID=UPI00345AE6B0
MATEKIDLNNLNINSLDKSDWKTYRFDEIAQNISERVDPNDTDLEVYVGLEHLDSESLHIKRHGTPDDVNGTKLRFYKGDIIFGRRRAYQRKAGIATCDGFCSAHALVLRANPDVIDPELFPFFIHSDLFMNRAIDISVGSLSPTINWGTLKHQEFLLPTKDYQNELAKLLQTVDAVLQSAKIYKENLENFYSVYVDNLFSKPNKNWSYKLLNEVANINQEALSSKTGSEYKFSYLDLASIEGPKKLGEMQILKYDQAPSRAKRVVKDNSIIIGLVRPYQQSIVYIEKSENIISSTGTAVIEAKSKIFSRFLFHQFFSSKFLRYCERMMTGTSYPAITSDDLSLYKIAVPKTYKEQEEIANKLDLIELNENKVRKKIYQSFKVQKSLINQVF